MRPGEEAWLSYPDEMFWPDDEAYLRCRYCGVRSPAHRPGCLDDGVDEQLGAGPPCTCETYGHCATCRPAREPIVMDPQVAAAVLALLPGEQMRRRRT